jgi:membrane protein required for colicin V production
MDTVVNATAFAPFDVVCALLMLAIAIRAALRGFVEEVSATASVVFGLFLAGFFFDEGAAYIRKQEILTISILPEIIAFILLFLAVFIIVKLVELLLKDIVRRVQITPADHALGFLFGLAEGIAVIILILFVLNIQPLFDAGNLLGNSIFARLLSPAPVMLRETLLDAHV